MRASTRRFVLLVGPILVVLVLSGAVAQAFKPTAEFGHVGIVKDGVKGITRPSADGTRTFKFSDRAIKELRDATAGVDELFSSRGEFFNPVAHCDDERLPECTQRLIDLKNSAIAALTSSSPDGEAARRETGRALHTLQDFYAHSNWVELGNSGFESRLGRSTIPRLAANQHTCGVINTGALTQFGLTNLTTGYFTAIIPFGKCAHGIPFVTPGINKDEPGRTGFPAARAGAVAGTTDFVNQILNAPGVAGNDKAIRAYMDVQGTLGFVIDDTGSMGPVIAGVKSVVSSIVSAVAGTDHQPDEYLLVRFGDPDVGGAFVTPDASAVLAAVNGLSAGGGGDCPELSMSGLLNAIQGAMSGSKLYLFTDASSKDGGLAGNVVAAAVNKDITINVGLSGSCSPIDPAYIAVSQGTGGQLMQTSHSLADTAKLFDLLRPGLTGDLQPIVVVNGTLGATPKELSVPIDSTMTAATFSVSTDPFTPGAVEVLRPDGSAVSGADPGVTITDVAGGRIVNVAAPVAGVWRLVITGGAGNFSATAMGNSPIRFNNFDFVALGGRVGEEGLFPILGQPVVGVPQQAKADIFGTASTATFELRSEAGDLLQTITLTKGGSVDVMDDEYYGTFTLPTERFRVYAKGTDAAGNAFLRAFAPTFRAQSVKVEATTLPTALPAGRTSTVTFKVTNLGGPDSFALTAVDPTHFVTGVSPQVVTLGTGESQTVDVSVDVPAGTPDATFVQLSIVAASVTDRSITNNAVVGLLVGAADAVAPATTATSAPAANAAGWNRNDVTVHLAAADEAGGSGVKELSYSATGAQPIAATVVPGDAADVTVTAEGITTLTFFATDNAGNVEPAQTLVVRIDKTAPEASVQFDPATKDIAVLGGDELSGPISGPAPFTSDRRTRTYMVLDVAGNALTLVIGVSKDDEELSARLTSLRYDDAAGVRTFSRTGKLEFDWDVAKGGSLKKLEQQLQAGGREAEAKFDAKKNETTIKVEDRRKVMRPGLVLLRIATANGALAIDY